MIERLKTGLKPLAMRSPRLRRIVRRLRLERGHLDWRGLGRPMEQPHAAPKVLLATSVGAWLPGSRLEGILAASLLLRGAEVHALLCDSNLPACLECTLDRLPGVNEMIDHGPAKQLCPSCFEPAARSIGQLGVPVHRYGDFLLPDDEVEATRIARLDGLADIDSALIDGVAVGEHAVAGALRFFARSDFDDEPGAIEVLQRYVRAAVLSARALERLLARERFDVVVAHHGIYIPQGIVGEVARRDGVRVVNWNPAYRKQSFIFSHGDTYHHTLLEEPTESWTEMRWSEQLESELMAYLRSRWSGSQDWIWFHERPVEEVARIEQETGIDFGRPCVGMLTNVMWDAQLHYRANAFGSMLEWCIETVRWFAGHPDLQLLIRVHPAEIRGSVPSRQRVVDELWRNLGQLPANVFVVPPESNVSTYVAMQQCDTVLIYGTKTGVELAAMGIPVIVAGEAWVRNKGVTRDASSKAEYIEMLEDLPVGARLDPQVVDRARRYAFHFFFRRMIPLGFLHPTGDERVFDLSISSLEGLRPGADAGLDVICDGILAGSPFIYPAENVG